VNKNFTDKTILVCGGAGFMGSAFIRRMHTEHPDARVVNFDKLTYSGNLENLADVADRSGYTFVRGDITDRVALEAVFKEYHPDFVVNFAAETHVDRSVHEGAEAFIDTNIRGVFTILELAREYKPEKYLQISTDEVYGDVEVDSSERCSETSLLKPSSPYAASKASGDLLCASYFRTYNIPVVVTRSGNNYGPYHYPEKIIPFFILRVMQGKTVPVYGDGKNVRNWVHVDDHARAVEICLANGKPGEIYNISSDDERDNIATARAILSYFKKDDSMIEFVKDRPGHDRKYAPDSTKLRTELGWKPEHSFDPALIDTIRWFENNQEWVRNILKRNTEINKHLT